MASSVLKSLCLGDSYTIGEGVKVGERWSTLWLQPIRDAGFAASPSRVIACTGWTTDELAQQIDVSQPEQDFDLVTLMIGVNNQYRGRSLDEFRDQLAGLIEIAIQSARGTPHRCLIISIPDWGVTPFAKGRDRQMIAQEIDAFNELIHQESQAAKTCFVDVTPLSRELSRRSDWLASDELHPGPAMHSAWTKIIAEAALRQLAFPQQPSP